MDLMLGGLFGISLATLVCIYIFISQTDITPIIPGQKWDIKGIGVIRIVRVLGDDYSFEELGKNIQVLYEHSNGLIGFSSKADIRRLGHIVPSKIGYPNFNVFQATSKEEEKDQEIDNILKNAERIRKNQEKFYGKRSNFDQPVVPFDPRKHT